MRLLRIALGAVAVFVAWTIGDIIIHRVILAEAYANTLEMWRPEAEMKMGLMQLVSVLSALGFTLIYALLVRPKSIKSGLAYGVLFGAVTGLGMGYATYAVMPIPYVMAMTWFNGSVLLGAVGGLLLGLIVKDKAS